MSSQIDVPRVSNWWLLALLILMTPSCGGDKRVLTPKSFGEQLVRAVCRNIYECRVAHDDASQLRSALQSTDACERSYAPLVAEAEQRLFGVSVAGLTFQPEQAAECLRRLPSQCFSFEVEEAASMFQTVCAEVFEGDVELGGACHNSLECHGDAYCEGVVDVCKPGTCRARKAPDESCVSNDECSAVGAESVACDFVDPGESLHCLQAKQVRAGRENETCGFYGLGHELVVVRCALPWVCAHGPDRYRCVIPHERGEACSAMPECAQGLICAHDGSLEAEEERRCDELALAEGELCDLVPDASMCLMPPTPDAEPCPP